MASAPRLHALLKGASSDQVAGDRAGELLKALPTSGTWQAEARVRGNPRRTSLKRRSKQGRLDWLLEATDDGEEQPRFVLGVEVKIEAAIANPLEAYYEELERKRAPAWGLLAETRPAAGRTRNAFPRVERRSNDGARPAPPRVGPQLARLYARPVIARYGRSSIASELYSSCGEGHDFPS